MGLELAFDLTAAGRALLLAGGLSVALCSAVAEPGAERLWMVLAGLAGLVALAALAGATLPAEAALVLLLLAAGQAAIPGVGSFSTRLRGPAFGVALLTLGTLASHYSTGAAFLRLAAVLLALGLVAAVGALPFLQPLAAGEPVAASPIAWLGFAAPALAIVLPAQAVVALDAASGPYYGGILVALGLLNLAWGGLGAWRAADELSAWRHSFLADWGLALVGLGLLSPGGAAASLLVLVSVIAVRLPLYLLARPGPLEGQSRFEPAQLLVAAALAGAAPFAGFPARLLLLKAAGDVYWPLALVLLPALLLWLPGSLRLARGVGRVRGRRALALAVVTAASVAIGLYPAPLLGTLGGG